MTKSREMPEKIRNSCLGMNSFGFYIRGMSLEVQDLEEAGCTREDQ